MPRHWLTVRVDLVSGRGDRAHLHTVELTDGTLLIGPGDTWDDPPQGRPVERIDRTTLSRLALGEQFAHIFDFGDDPPVHDRRPAPRSAPGARRGAGPAGGVPGAGSLPDQYGRRFDKDDGEMAVPPDPRGSDLPAIRYDWGPRSRACT